MELTSKEMRLLKDAINTLESLLEKVEERVEKRTETFDNRSEKWQESETGEAYQYETDELEDFRNEIENALDYVRDYAIYD